LIEQHGLADKLKMIFLKHILGCSRRQVNEQNSGG
jgi:hypothetical protein